MDNAEAMKSQVEVIDAAAQAAKAAADAAAAQAAAAQAAAMQAEAHGEEIQKAVKKATAKEPNYFALGFFVGFAAGLAAAVVFSPRSGEETRTVIQHRLREGGRSIPMTPPNADVAAAYGVDTPLVGRSPFQAGLEMGAAPQQETGTPATPTNS
ncbi:MAG: YtxH domain-containing protein [Anaerolineae bacterium]